MHRFQSRIWIFVAGYCGFQCGLGGWACAAERFNPDVEQKMGKVLSIEKKGVVTKLKVDLYDGSGQLEIPFSRATNCAVTFKGDTNFFRNGAWVQTTATVTGKALYASSFDVYVKAKMAPHYEQNPRTKDISICGQVTAADPGSITLASPRGPLRILLDDRALENIHVFLTTPDAIEAGAEAEIEGVTRGKKFVPQKVIVKLDKPLTAEQAFSRKKIDHSTSKSDPAAKEPAEPGAAVKPKPVPRGKKNVGPAQNPEEPDPFGILGDKTNNMPKKGAKKK